MFVIDLSPTYFAPVSFDLLGENGNLVTHAFDAQFKRMDAGALDALDAEIRAIPSGSGKDLGLLERVMVGWRGVQDASGDLAFSVEALRAVCAKVPRLRGDLVSAFIESNRPQQKAHFAEKN